jgi:hypothetical protein
MNAYTTKQPHETSAAAIIRNSIVLAGAAALVGILLATVAGVLGLWIAGPAAAQWGFALTILATALALAALLKSAWDNSRWILVETIASRIAKTNAEAARLEAEAKAIAASKPAVIQTVNAEAGAKVKASITAPRVTVQGKEISWNQITALQAGESAARTLTFPAADVRWMLEQFANVKHSKRLFIGESLPYSEAKAYPELYNEIIRVLVDAGAIVGRSDRTSGQLLVKDPGQLMKIVDQTHPGGNVTLELPALPEPSGIAA